MTSMVTLFCPYCGGLMACEEVEVRFWRAPVSIRESILFCRECPVATQVDANGRLIDIPGGFDVMHLQDPPDDEMYLTRWEKQDLND